MLDLVTSVLELAAVALLVAGAGLVVAALVGGVLGAGVGLMAAGGVSAAASTVLQVVHRPQSGAAAVRRG